MEEIKPQDNDINFNKSTRLESTPIHERTQNGDYQFKNKMQY